MAILQPFQRTSHDLPLEELYTLDIESSGSPFDEESFPVSLGVAGPSGRIWHWLIKPAEGWEHWDEIAEEIHGISREELEEGGWDIQLLCHEINRQFAGQVLVVDSLADLKWASKLFTAAGVQVETEIAYITSVLDRDHALRVIASIDEMDWPHRADQDAILLRNAITLYT